MIGRDLAVEGAIQNADIVEVWGSVRGAVLADHLVIHPGGMVTGRIDTGGADVNGLLDGRVRVRNLISIGPSGAVRGNVRYGRLSLAMGGDLAAEVRNVPPELGGDFEVVVKRGQSVAVTSADLHATDAEDGAAALTYAVSNVARGFLALVAAPRKAIIQFTQADIEAGRVLFVHDGSGLDPAGFDVVVADSQGATTGAPRRVSVAVLE
ncbi:MAG: polymer-forming cytoskeletal protein [Hyphomicrobiaceae bacterium]